MSGSRGGAPFGPASARWSRHALLGTPGGPSATNEPTDRASRRSARRGWILAAALLGGAARIAAGVLWLGEGILKYRAGFGAADILLVAQSTAGNSRVPFYFRPLGAVMQAVPALFGLAIPALEVALGVLLVLGAGRVLTVLAALGSVATLMLYWSSDQLITQYPVLVLLSTAVLVLPRSEWFGVAWLWRRVRDRRGR